MNSEGLTPICTLEIALKLLFPIVKYDNNLFCSANNYCIDKSEIYFFTLYISVASLCRFS